MLSCDVPFCNSPRRRGESVATRRWLDGYDHFGPAIARRCNSCNLINDAAIWLKHICQIWLHSLIFVGGSSGTLFAWDLRWQQWPILLSGVCLNGTDQPVSESEVCKVQYDSYTQSSGITSALSTKILPVMVCSEDGILVVLEQGEDPVELLAEPCAINAFDIDPQNPFDVVCALEWESMAILSRGRDAMAIQ
ncbi:Nuclear pore complex protein NUP43 [Ananas comosus]|uniref:Nuclear pore complex protein NUP43 n=1 Tax=Ananas comosus TaxID=4615 RepID=A0A199UYK2_ANACO|nr:Nuclear pore complex protein NUP43 [Ananas comosus]